jgi:serine/threonine protein kinase
MHPRYTSSRMPASEDDVPTLPRPAAETSANEQIVRGVLHYQIVRKLGHGAMGEVFLARDTKLQRDVALKFPTASLRADPDAVRRLEREAQAAGRIVHANVVRVYSLEYSDEGPFIVTEFIDGQDLATILATETLPVESAVRLIERIASGLAAAHQLGVIHRDVKPHNIRVRPNGEPVIVDFGLGKFVGDRSDGISPEEITRGRQLLGTLQYMSPEQVQGLPLTPSTDIFSFGVLAYQIFGAPRPFDRDSAAATIAAILQDQHPSIRTFRPEVSASISNIIESCLTKPHDDRPAADSVANQLRSSTPAVPPRFIPAAEELAPRRPSAEWFRQQRQRARQRDDTSVFLEFTALFVSGAPQQFSVQRLHESLARLVNPVMSTVTSPPDADRLRRTEDAIFAEGASRYWAVRGAGESYQASAIRTLPPRTITIEGLWAVLISSIKTAEHLTALFSKSGIEPITFHASLIGAADHVLRSENADDIFAHHLEHWSYRCDLDTARATIQVTPTELRDDLRGAASNLATDLLGYFDFANVPDRFFGAL